MSYLYDITFFDEAYRNDGIWAFYRIKHSMESYDLETVSKFQNFIERESKFLLSSRALKKTS